MILLRHFKMIKMPTMLDHLPIVKVAIWEKSHSISLHCQETVGIEMVKMKRNLVIMKLEEKPKQQSE